MTVEPVRDQDWPVVARLWQAYRNDLAPPPARSGERTRREAFGDAWREELRAAPGLSDVPPDHWISST